MLAHKSAVHAIGSNAVEDHFESLRSSARAVQGEIEGHSRYATEVEEMLARELAGLGASALQTPRNPDDEAAFRREVLNQILRLKTDLRALHGTLALRLYEHISQADKGLPPRALLAPEHFISLRDVFGDDSIWMIDAVEREAKFRSLDISDEGAGLLGIWDLTRVYISYVNLREAARGRLNEIMNDKRRRLDQALSISSEEILVGNGGGASNAEGRQQKLSRRELDELRAGSSAARSYVDLMENYDQLIERMKVLRSYRDGLNSMHLVAALESDNKRLYRENAAYKEQAEDLEVRVEKLVDSRREQSVALEMQLTVNKLRQRRDFLEKELAALRPQHAQLTTENARLQEQIQSAQSKLAENSVVIDKQRKLADAEVRRARIQADELKFTVTRLLQDQDLLASMFKKVKVDTKGVREDIQRQKDQSARDQVAKTLWQRERDELRVELARRLRMMRVAAAAAIAAKEEAAGALAARADALGMMRDALAREGSAADARSEAEGELRALKRDSKLLEKDLDRIRSEGYVLRAKLAAREEEMAEAAREHAEVERAYRRARPRIERYDALEDEFRESEEAQRVLKLENAQLRRCLGLGPNDAIPDPEA